jgi:hypothetical protein
MRPLYCACVEVMQRDGSMKPSYRYMHIPENEGQPYAERMFAASHQSEIMSGRMRVISVALAIGYHALDDNGDQAVA